MSVKHALLALLAARPTSAYTLKTAFEEATGNTWTLNMGQVSTTLARLERDGLAVHPDKWRITDEGRAELAHWYATPILRLQPARDELVIKLVMAARTSPAEVPGIVQRQRTATMSALHDFTRLKDDSSDSLTWSLIIDYRIFSAEAELRWLDHVEGRLAAHGPLTYSHVALAAEHTEGAWR